jgi:hypothetical protein
MKKICLVVFLFFLTSCAFATTPHNSMTQSPDQAIQVTDDLQLTSQDIKDENPDLYYQIEGSYPKISGETLTPSAEKFNQAVSAIVNTELDEFKKYVKEDSIHIKTLPEEMRKNYLDIDYEIDLIQPKQTKIISVRISVEGMQAGRAHPYHKTFILNFDFTNGKVLALSDLFKPKSNYLKIISDYCQKTLSAKLEDKFMISEGTKPIEKNFTKWNMEADHLLITFDEYQVAPYVYGLQEVEIPYSELKNVIAPGSVIAERAPPTNSIAK